MKKVCARVLALILFFIAVLPVLSCCSQDETDINSITSFKEIKTVTAEEIADIEAVVRNRDYLVFGQMLETEAFVLPNSELSGFTAKLCSLLTQLFGIEFRLDIYGWQDLIDGLENRTIDFTGDLTYKEARIEAGFFMSHAIAERSLRLFTLDYSEEIVDEKQLNGLKVGTLAGTIDNELISNYYPHLSFEFVEVNDFSDVQPMLLSGEIDAFVTEGVIDPIFDIYKHVRSKEFFPLVYTPVSLSTKNSLLKSFITVMDKYLEAGGIDKLFDLYKEGDYEYAGYKLAKSFTANEKAYLESFKSGNKKITIALESDNYPVSFYNEKEKQFQGIAIDVFTSICNLLGIQYKIVTDRTTAWSAIMTQLSTGEIDMTAQLLKTAEREASKQFLWSAVPYASANYALLSRADYPELANYQVLRATVAVVRDSGHHAMYNKWFPDNTNAKIYETQYAALAALEKGEVDLVMGSDYMLLMQTNYLEKPGFKVNIRFNEPTDSFFGFSKNNELLCSVFNKAQTYIKADSIENIWMSKVFDYSKKLANERSVYLLIMAAVVLLAAALAVFFLYKNSRRKAAEQAAQGASKAKSAFLARMSHEIRTPLNAIIGMANIANNSISDKEKTQHSVRQIISSSQHLLEILNDILDMSKIESGKLVLVREPFNLTAAVLEVSDIILQRCGEKNINFITNISELGTLFVVSDKLRLCQVLINLLGNAVKFTPVNGEIKLLADKISEDDSQIRIKFSVIDNGIGMSPEQQAKLFVPFEQADPTISIRYGGTGLGLSISQNLINMMGGAISVESRQNVGSDFNFELVFEKSANNEEPLKEPDSVPDFSGKTILVVEDVEINRVILGEILAPTGVSIVEAENGQAGLDIFDKSEENKFDLILMDIRMPVLDGYEATRAIRKLKRRDAANVPIIAMTANAYKEDADLAMASGMNGHLAKPVEIKLIFKMLTEMLNKKK